MSGSSATPILAALFLAATVLLALPATVSTRRAHRVARGSAPGVRSTLRPGVRPGNGRPVASPGHRPWLPRSEAGQVPVPMVLDLVAEVIASGVPPPRALAVVADCLDAALGRGSARTAGDLILLSELPMTGSYPGPPERTTARTGRDDQGSLQTLAAALGLAVITGAGPVGLIRAAAEDERGRRQAERLRAARRLGVSLLLPTGLCLLPAFIVLTVVPLALDLVLR